MLKIVLATFTLAMGCVPDPKPELNPNTGLASLLIATSTEGTDISPKPDPDPAVCKNCNGKGWVGDGVTKYDCDACDLDPLAGIEVMAGVIKELNAKVAAFERQIQMMQAEQEVDAINWVSYDEALKTGKPIWVHFEGTNCGPCRRLESQVFSDPEIWEISRGFACVKFTDSPKAMTAFGLPTTIPADAFVSTDKKIYHQGLSPGPSQFKAYLTSKSLGHTDVER